MDISLTKEGHVIHNNGIISISPQPLYTSIHKRKDYSLWNISKDSSRYIII